MQAEARRPRSLTTLVVLVVLAALGCAGFVALGVWQLQRLGWKEALIARVERNVHAAPIEAPGPAAWPALTRESDEYRRLRIAGRFAYDKQALVRASTALGSGYWVLTPLRTPGGNWVLVNRGFVPQEMREQVPRADPQAAVVGLLRFSEPGGGLLQHNDPAAGRWYSRDVGAIAADRGLEGPVAPYFVDAQATPATAAAWPRAGLTVIAFSNNHLVYALTWFGLAALMAGAIGYLLVDARRHRRVPGAPSLGDRPT